MKGARGILRCARRGEAMGEAAMPASPPTGDMAYGDREAGPPKGLAASPDL